MSMPVIKGSKQVKIYAISAIFVAFMAVPFFAFSSRHGELFVNTKASGFQDGSREHPFEKIGSAVDKANSNTEIHIAKGEYEENLTLKKGIKLFGEDADNTIIKAKKDKWATIFMKDNSEIDDLTIKGGKSGVFIESHAQVDIISCVVKYNNGDGIIIEGGDTKKANQVYIGKSEIRNNDRAGIFVSGQRRVVVMDSDIFDNGTDGVDMARGTASYFAGNSVKNNGGSGLRAVIDDSDIWTKNNSFRENGREGMEVASFGGAGRINVAKAKFVSNGRYGVARLQKAGAISSAAWDKYLTFDQNAYFASNGLGNISRILRAN